MEHVLTAGQFSQEDCQAIFERADCMREASAGRGSRKELLARHAGSVMATVFYEPSTRTRLSFESAGARLGIGVISTENAAEFSSAAKGESIEDSIRVIAGYADIVVLRHKEEGAAKRAAAVSKVPIINAGDGIGEHPTQALLDAYTIWNEHGRLQDLHIVIGGDLAHGRTARSLGQIMAGQNNHFSFVSTPQLKMGDDIKNYVKAKGSSYTETDNLTSVLPNADVVYWTRLQKERLADSGQQAGFTIGQDALDKMPPHAIIMHPLPRVDEIDEVVDKDPRAAYFRQAENGLYVRMALLDMLLS